jgi:HAD superfamily hydrolase (TIGR01490 family)
VRAAFFDLDKTVIAKASIAAFGRPLYRGGMINRRLVARALVSQLIYLHLGASEQKLARVRESMLTLTKGWDRDQITEIVREALEETVEPIIYAEALDLIEAHRAAGHRVYLVSASPDVIVQPLAEHLGVDGAISSRPFVDEDGRYTGEMEFYAYGPFKAEAMREMAVSEGLDLEESSAYSDSYTDLPMLEAVGHPVAVNPDRVLAKVAREREWEVMQFTKPVRLRDRVSVPSLPLTATAAGITAAASVGALVAWRLARRPQR